MRRRIPGEPVLLVGSFPPVPGPVTDATVALTRELVAAATPVTTAGGRPGAAALVVRVAGPLAGRRLAHARRATGAAAVVLALDEGIPARRPRAGGPGRWLDVAVAIVAVAGLARALSAFESATVLVAADTGLPRAALALLWRACAEVLVVDGAPAASVPVGLRTRRPPPPALRGLVAGVTPLGPVEVSPLAMPRYMAGRIGRVVLGRRFLPVYHRTLRALDLGRRLRRRAVALARR